MRLQCLLFFRRCTTVHTGTGASPASSAGGGGGGGKKRALVRKYLQSESGRFLRPDSGGERSGKRRAAHTHLPLPRRRGKFPFPLPTILLMGNSSSAQQLPQKREAKECKWPFLLLSSVLYSPGLKEEEEEGGSSRSEGVVVVRLSLLPQLFSPFCRPFVFLLIPPLSPFWNRAPLPRPTVKKEEERGCSIQ